MTTNLSVSTTISVLVFMQLLYVISAFFVSLWRGFVATAATETERTQRRHGDGV
jgi:hypothetical protein